MSSPGGGESGRADDPVGLLHPKVVCARMYAPEQRNCYVPTGRLWGQLPIGCAYTTGPLFPSFCPFIFYHSGATEEDRGRNETFIEARRQLW